MLEEFLSLSELENFDSRSSMRGKERRFCCPRCGSAKPKDAAHRSLTVNTENGAFYCHRCQTKGRLREFWEERPQIPKKARARQKLISHFSIETVDYKKEKTADEAVKEENLAEKMLEFQKNFAGSAAEKYLESRGISAEIAIQSGCGFAPKWEHWEKDSEKWKLKGSDERVIFPVYDRQEKLVAMHSRAIGENHFNSSKITKGNKSEGIFATRKDIFSAKIAAICEAPIDALALEMCGIPAVAMIGTSVPDWLALKFSFKQVLIATDADLAGDKAAFNLQNRLASRGAKFYRLRPRTAKDWAEVLENIGAEKLTEFLLPFAENLSDERRFCEAVKLYETGRN
nr:toprim domain-containing protein [Pyrinomonadaceae bacterium]